MSLRESERSPLRAASDAYHSQHERTYTEPWEVGVLDYKTNICIWPKHKSTNHGTCNDQYRARTHSHTKHLAWLTKTNPTNTKIAPGIYHHKGNTWVASNFAYAYVATCTRASGHHTESDMWAYQLVKHITHITFVYINHNCPLFSSAKNQFCTKCPNSPKMHFAHQTHVHSWCHIHGDTH